MSDINLFIRYLRCAYAINTKLSIIIPFIFAMIAYLNSYHMNYRGILLYDLLLLFHLYEIFLFYLLSKISVCKVRMYIRVLYHHKSPTNLYIIGSNIDLIFRYTLCLNVNSCMNNILNSFTCQNTIKPIQKNNLLNKRKRTLRYVKQNTG